MKNIIIHNHYEKKYSAFGLIYIKDLNEDDIKEWIQEQNKKRDEGNKLPEYKCVNQIINFSKEDFIKEKGVLENIYDEPPPEEYSETNKNKKTSKVFDSKKDYFDFIHYHQLPKTKYFKDNEEENEFIKITVASSPKVYKFDELKNEIKNFSKGVNLGFCPDDAIGKTRSRLYIGYEDINNKDTIKLILRVSTIKDKQKVLPRQTIDIKETPYICYDDIVDYTILKDEYKTQLPDKYYFITPTGWLYLRDNNINSNVSLNIIQSSRANLIVVPDENIIIENIPHPTINSDVKLFINSCCEVPNPPNLRMGITEIYNIYKEWCLENSKNFLKKQDFKCEIEKGGINDDERKGIDINNKPGKRGYNIMVKI
jgi:hypothetical protein